MVPEVMVLFKVMLSDVIDTLLAVLIALSTKTGPAAVILRILIESAGLNAK